MTLLSLARSHRRWMTVLALLPFVLLVAKVWGSQPDLVNSDWVQYMAHAKALLAGRPYTDTGYLFTSVRWGFAPAAYPPGLPIALAGAFAVFGTSIVVAKAVALVMAVMFLLIAGAYFTRASGPALGACVALLLGLSPRVLEHSVSPLSDIPFAALIWLTILLVDREGDWGPRRVIAVTAAAGVAILFRPHGLILIPSLLLWGAWRRLRGGTWATLVPGMGLFALTVLGRLVLPDASRRGFPAVRVLWHHLFSPDLRYHLAVFESHLYPFRGDLANDVFHVFTIVFMIGGLGAFVWRNPTRFAVVFGVVYCLALAAMPGHNVRFAFPLYPLFVFGLLNGICLAVRWLVPERALLATAVFAVGLAVAVTSRGLATQPAPRRMDDPEVVELVQYLANRVKNGEKVRIAAFRPRYLASVTGAPGMVLVPRIGPERHLRLWCDRGITDVVLGGIGAGRRFDLARRAIALVPGAFSRVFVNADFQVWHMDPVLAGC